MIFDQLKQGLIIALILSGSVALAQFIEPTGSPLTMNATEPMTQGNTRQQKSGDLIADYLTARNKWCLGSNCITSLWSSLAPSSCHLEMTTVNVSWDVNLAYNTCDRILTSHAKNQGWLSMGGDNCSGMSSGNCASGRVCVFGRIACSGGVSNLNTSTQYKAISNVIMHPATATAILGASGGAISLPYDLTRNPQCNDGINNDGAAGIDMLDPQCKHLGDDSESIL
jgi:hypothetical protein